MASLSSLHKLFKAQKLLLPMNAHKRRMVLAASPVHRTLFTDDPNAVHMPTLQMQIPERLSKRHFADKSTTESLAEFRKREEQRERDANAAAESADREQCDGKSHETGEEEATRRAKVESLHVRILDAALTHVPRLGWTREAIVCGAEELGLPSTLHGMFPEGGFALVSYFNRKCNEELVLKLQQQTDNGQKQVDNPLEFLVQAVRQRMEMILPYKAQWPQAMALIAIPSNASTALAQVLTLVDDICYYSGDRSVDFGWYTRRVGLATILKITELYLLQDSSPQHANTWDFLKNRMEEAVQLQMMLAKSEGMTHTFQRSFNSAFVTARNILGLGYSRN